MEKREERRYKIKARVFSMEEGHEGFDNVKQIKILSSKYNIVIMEDYLPVIGEVDGDVQFVFENEVREIKNVQGYYKHSHNDFELLIKRRG